MNVNAASAEMNAFVRVVERGSFAAAADDLGITPSALSKLVTRIEDRLGVQPADPDHAPARPDRRGRTVCRPQPGHPRIHRGRRSRGRRRQAGAARSSADQRRNGLRQTNTSVRRFRFFLRYYPDITVELHVSDRQIDLVAEQVDVAIRSGALGDSTLVARKIAEATRVICASPLYLEKHGSPLVPADLLQHNCLTLPGLAWSQWPFHTHEGINRLAVSGTFTSDNADLLLDMAVAGLGIARLADFMVARAVTAGHARSAAAGQPDAGVVSDPCADGPGPPPRAARSRPLSTFVVEQFGQRP